MHYGVDIGGPWVMAGHTAGHDGIVLYNRERYTQYSQCISLYFIRISICHNHIKWTELKIY